MMRKQPSKPTLAASLLVLSPAAWAHPALFDGGMLASLAHLLTQPDHLLLLAGISLAAGIAWSLAKKE